MPENPISFFKNFPNVYLHFANYGNDECITDASEHATTISLQTHPDGSVTPEVFTYFNIPVNIVTKTNDLSNCSCNRCNIRCIKRHV